jgi:hypothetical protein
LCNGVEKTPQFLLFSMAKGGPSAQWIIRSYLNWWHNWQLKNRRRSHTLKGSHSMGDGTARTCTAILCNSLCETFAAEVPALLTVCTTFPKLARNISIQWPHTRLTTTYTRSCAALRGWDPPPYDRSNICSLIRGGRADYSKKPPQRFL